MIGFGATTRQKWWALLKRNVQFQQDEELHRNVFVGHRFGKHFADIVMSFDGSRPSTENKKRKRVYSLEEEEPKQKQRKTNE